MALGKWHSSLSNNHNRRCPINPTSLSAKPHQPTSQRSPLSSHFLSAAYQQITTQSEIDGSIGFIFGPDTLIIEDGTYFVLTLQENPELIVACGGWSFRKTLYGGDLAPSRKPARQDPPTERASIRAIFTHPD
jgi:hypothetical protein